MFSLTDGAVIAVQAEGVHQYLGELLLLLDRIGDMQPGIIRLFCGADLGDQRDKCLLELAEECVVIFFGCAFLVFVQSHVERILAWVCKFCEVFLSLYKFFDDGFKGCPVAGELCLVPYIAGLAEKLGVGDIFVGGHDSAVRKAPAKELCAAEVDLSGFLLVIAESVHCLPQLIGRCKLMHAF